jgi:hypothetical protein
MHRTMAHRYTIFQTDQGYEVLGLLQPVNEGQIPAYQWATPRLVFRTSPESLATAGTIIVDAFGRRLILGTHGNYQVGPDRLYKVFRIIEANKHVSWTRKTTTLDPVTKLQKKDQDIELGPIWVAVEPLGRLDGDRDVRVREDGHQIVTSADVKLNDVVDGQIVRRVQEVLGIKLLETT